MSSLSTVEFNEAGDALGRWWSPQQDGRILCQLCPRACRLKPGDRGFCFVRANRDGKMVLDTYGRSTGFCIDPIEKKPLNHFLPGTPVLSFGTAGCNLGCKFCQNWDISKSREVARLSDTATPEGIAQAAKQQGCRSVAFTYNDPVIWAEYAIDTAAACRAEEIKTVAVTAGYITPEARGEFFDSMDAANIDLKAFTEEFYHRLTGAHLDPVLDTIRYACRETPCWVELTNLVIPEANDDGDEIRRMVDWVLETVGCDVPVHFTAFHPDFRMTDRPRTSHETLIEAYNLARDAGLRYVYLGNVHDVARQSTYCPSCGQLLIQRDWHQLGHYALDQNRCRHCQFEVAGCFEAVPGNWGQRRQPIRISQVDPPRSTTQAQETTMQDATVEPDLQFSAEQQTRILQAAARIVCGAAYGTEPAGVDHLLDELGQRPISGVYVTLKRGETLRGCCGLQGPPVQLAAALADAGHRTTVADPRMPPVTPVELPYLDLTVSILGPPRPIGADGDARIDAVKVGQHGLRIAMGKNAGLLLPSVAKERNWNSRQFLDAVCRKAGLVEASWRSDQASIQIFDGVDFGGPLANAVELTDSVETGAIDPQQLGLLRGWVNENLVAMQAGATPLYYAVGVTDGTVPGVVLQIVTGPDQSPESWMHFTLRNGVPLQATLLRLTQTAVNSLAGRGAANGWQIRLAVLSSVVHHGNDAEADLGGMDCKRRAILALDGTRWSLGFDQSSQPQQLFDETLSQQPFRPSAVHVYSAVCDCTEPKFSMSMGPQAETSVTRRPPGVAGGFYPASDNDRERLVDQLLPADDSIQRQSVAAAMVPHAGLRFSGKVAADVWRRIEIPKNVLIIGPKHTADGVDWAVAPHDWWELSPSAGMPGAPDLAEQIAQAVPGMELDAAAHRQEHGIEVQLPLLYRLAPQTRVAAIAMNGASHEELVPASAALANWIRSLEDPPLLVISSDMNHFADDAENRRRDALALDMLQNNDPAGLLRVCDDENISMCGRVPAALVLMTLEQLGKTPQYDQIAYATSGDITGDRARVVGYAGVLF